MKLFIKLKRDGIITLLGHIGDKTSKNRGKKKYTELQGGMKLSLAANLVLN